LKYAGLERFWEVFRKAINISPLDGDGQPSISMLPVILPGFEIDMDEKTFWDCTEIAMLRYREKVAEERKKQIAKMKRSK
jgi:hypothetical protein